MILLCADPNHTGEMLAALAGAPAVVTYLVAWLRCRVLHRRKP